MGDDEKLEFFDSCLSPSLRHMIRYLYKGGDKIAFEHVFSILEQRNGQRASQQAVLFGKMSPSRFRGKSPSKT